MLGPMTGYPEENRPAFKKATEFLRKQGFIVVSPDELDRMYPAKGKSWKDYMERDIPHVVTSSCGIALPGWRMSKGATVEAALFAVLERPVFELVGEALVPIHPSTLPKITHP